MVNNETVEKFFTRHETALHLKLSKRSIDRLIRDNRIRAFRIGRRVLIYSSSLTEENLLSYKPNFNNK